VVVASELAMARKFPLMRLVLNVELRRRCIPPV
jgi:hypothetical protein